MIYLKKLIFALPFLIFLSLFYLSLLPFLKDPSSVVSINLGVFVRSITLLLYLILAGISYALLIGMSQSYKLVLPVILLALILPLVLGFDHILPLVLGGLASLLVGFLIISKSLKSYLNFSPSQIFSSGIKNYVRLMILGLSISYFLVMSAQIEKNGFKIPDSVMDPIIAAFTANSPASEISSAKSPFPGLSSEQTALLKQNPSLLKQYGLDPKILDNLPEEGSKSTDLIKATVNSQINNLITPYLKFMPIVLALLMFLSLTSVSSIIFIFVPPLLTLIFYILEKSQFIRFEKEMRETKKLVV